MATLFLKKINESLYHVYSDDQGGILRELSDYYSFLAPGARYDKRVQIGIWDGKIRLVNLREKTIPSGLIADIENFTSGNGYNLVDETLPKDRNVSDNQDDFDEWLKSLKLPFEPRDYQYKAVRDAIKDMRCILLSPTGSGKSLIIYLLVRWMLRFDRKTVIIVPSTSLVEQMISDFKDYSKNDDSFDVDSVVKGLYSKSKCDPYEEKVVIATWQSLIRYDSSLYSSWDCVICDECHQGKAKSIQTIIGGAVNAPFRYGLTGSLTGENVHYFVLMGSFGKVHQVTTTLKLQKKGELSNLKIYMITLSYPKDENEEFYHNNKKDWMAEVEYLSKHPLRQKFMRNLALACKGTTILFFNLKEHGWRLYEDIKAKAGDRPVFHVDGDTSAQEREKIRNAVKDNKDTILVFSQGTSAVGLNIPSIQNVILHNSKSRVRNLQSIGRGLRLDDQKDGCRVYDIVDDMSYRNHKNYMLKHALERFNLYMSEGFDVISKTVSIPSQKPVNTFDKEGNLTNANSNGIIAENKT